MAARKEDIVDTGSRWNDGNGNKFYVTEVETRESGTWVMYTKEKNGSEYSCLVDAFLQRFRMDPA
jgi:hypothetical protein